MLDLNYSSAVDDLKQNMSTILLQGKEIKLTEKPALTCILVQLVKNNIGKYDNYLYESFDLAKPNRIAVSDITCLGTAPGEWWFVSCHPAIDVIEQLSTGLGKAFIITDMSHGKCTLEISGTSAYLLLAKGCGLDFHQDTFNHNMCAQTLFARVDVLIQPLLNSSFRSFTEDS